MVKLCTEDKTLIDCGTF